MVTEAGEVYGMDPAELQSIYLQKGYYWGKEPNRLAETVVRLIPPEQRSSMRLVDLGAGEGRDSVFLARQGFSVTAVDLVPAGLAKARRLAREANVDIATAQGDLNDVALPGPFEVVYSNGALEYIRPELRIARFTHFKAQTSPGGLHFMFAFSEHPEIEIAPDWGSNEYLYRRGELASYYEDWEVLDHYERIFDCTSSGTPHRHAASVVVARKPLPKARVTTSLNIPC
jgi:tellurite methyltransferase